MTVKSTVSGLHFSRIITSHSRINYNIAEKCALAMSAHENTPGILCHTRWEVEVLWCGHGKSLLKVPDSRVWLCIGNNFKATVSCKPRGCVALNNTSNRTVYGWKSEHERHKHVHVYPCTCECIYPLEATTHIRVCIVYNTLRGRYLHENWYGSSRYTCRYLVQVRSMTGSRRFKKCWEMHGVIDHVVALN